MTKIAKEMDENKRMEMVKKAQEILADDLPTITICHPKSAYAYRTDKFTGWNNVPINYGAMYYPSVSIINLISLKMK
jgi:ABC-type transport system substrate-binding protein